MGQEFEIRDRIVEYLEKRNILCWKDPKPIYTSKRGFSKSNGVPDIHAILPDGRYLGIEVKTKTGKLSDSQKKFFEKVSHTKAIVILARSLDDVMNCLTKEKLFSSAEVDV